MTAENTAQSSDLHEETRSIWNQNAAFWDDKMRDGNDFQRILVGPASERLLNLQVGEIVLEIACGNGVFARRMAQLGVSIVATDFSAQLLERAQARTSEYADRIEYRLVDATQEDQMIALGLQRFDAVVCNMAIMDMSEIDPLMRGIRQVLKPGGRFVFLSCIHVLIIWQRRYASKKLTTMATSPPPTLSKLPDTSILLTRKGLAYSVSLLLTTTFIVPCISSSMPAFGRASLWTD